MTTAPAPTDLQPLAFLDPAVRANPYPTLAALREHGPARVPELNITVFSSYNDCTAVLGHPQASADRRRSAAAEEMLARVPPDVRAEIDRRRVFLFQDPPDHTRLRGLVAKAFTRRRVEALRPRVQEIVDAAVDSAAATGEMELLADLAYPLPVAVICELLGVPVEDHVRFRGWSRDLAASLDEGLTGWSDREATRAWQSGSALRAYLGELADRRRRLPGDDLLSALVAQEESGDRLTEDELLSTCMLLLVAGHETTVNLIANGVLALLRHPDQLARLAADPGLGETCVDEVLRYDPPVQVTGRIMTGDVELGGVTVPVGDVAVLALGAANRDPAAFTDPDRFDIGRPDAGRHLAFSKGVHFCLGAPLARLEGQVALTTLAHRLVAPRLVDPAPPYTGNAVLRGVAALPVAFTATRPA